MKAYLTKEEAENLIVKVRTGDNAAWKQLYENYNYYIRSRAAKLLADFDESARNRMQEELLQAGWIGFIGAVKNFRAGEGSFLTYATYYIDGEMKKERSFQLNTLGLTEKPKEIRQQAVSVEEAEEAEDDRLSLEIARALQTKETDEAETVKESYPGGGRAIQILEIMRMFTDEEHKLSKEKIKELLTKYRRAKYNKIYPDDSDNTITATMEDLIEELDPLEYTGENDSAYRILYSGYQEDRFKEKKNKEKTKGMKAKTISDFCLNHLFTKEELNLLIEQISLSNMISEEEKEILVGKLISTASLYYKTPFWDGKKINFNPKAIHGRFDSPDGSKKKDFARNIAVMQEALNNLGQVRFRFNRFTEDGRMVPASEHIHELSPYHLVLYRDNYYCIGLKKDGRKIWHYRVDLMSEIEILRDEQGRIVPIELSAFPGLPILNESWDPQKYLSEHLNMAYDEPREVHIKIRNTDYTILHDWFSGNYEKTDQAAEEGMDIVKVITSPSMIVHWALQYAGAVEIMDEEIREKIREEIKKVSKKYGSSIF